ncbi:penicillin-binding protein 2 [Ectothiorhodospira mobilis]|uniref:penicillin-binding protein 2 n=1 Tax=Ectothiorhodospira mobilis TaxID=195064 RepID=UPI001902C5CD|nr:penicillin-binding protein 2 [Ectothiorhodospira mobilis]MBK1691230.1 penicillin-binding protein 2 [Ectothiorhodospira mobilis]
MSLRQPLKNHHQEQRLFLTRVVIVAIGVVLLFGVLAVRMGLLQVVGHSHFATLSQNNRVRLEVLPPPRGLIYDRHGRLLAENRPAYQLEVIPEQVDDMDDTLERLSRIIPLSDVEIRRFRSLLERKRAFQSVPLKLNLDEDALADFAVNRHRFPGVDVHARVARHYPQGAVMAHVVGYVGRINERELAEVDADRYAGTTHIGKTGVERHYESVLHGEPGYQKVEVNAQGRVLRVLERHPPRPGRDLVLGIDVRLQRVAQEALSGHAGAVVAMDPHSGEVLAMVSLPGFDPNRFVHGISFSAYDALRTDRRQPLFNRALSGQYPPGSTLKPVIALAGLEHEVIRAGEVMHTHGYYTLPNHSRRYRDWKNHGAVDMDKAITQSSDVYFYDLGHELGIDRLSGFLARFGLGKRTGIDSTGERPGILPSREWKQATHDQPWYPGETLITAIGQGYMLTTPMQMASVAATLATRGERVQPRLLRRYADPDGGSAHPLHPVPLTEVELNDPGNWAPVLESMEHVVHQRNGTAHGAIGSDLGYRMAGKTGTSQVFSLADGEEYDAEELAFYLRDHALFIGFAPAKDPRIAVAVVVEHGGSGGAVAAPVARRVMDAYLLEEAS